MKKLNFVLFEVQIHMENQSIFAQFSKK